MLRVHRRGRAIRRLAADDRFKGYVEGVARPDAFGPEVYLEALLDLGCAVDAWETTYLHLLHGDDPVFTWVSGTGARPVLQAFGAKIILSGKLTKKLNLKGDVKASKGARAAIEGAAIRAREDVWRARGETADANRPTTTAGAPPGCPGSAR